MTRRRFGLRAQFILLIVVGLLVLFAVVTVVVVRQSTKNLQNGLVEGSKSFASLATKPIGDAFALYQDSGRIKIVQQIDKFATLDNNVSNIGVVDVSGRLLYEQYEKLSDVNASTEQASSFENIYVYENGRLTKVIVPYIEDFGAHRYSIVYSISYEAVDQATAQLTKSIVGLALIALVGTAFVSYLLISRLFLKPISQVSEGATAISKGDLEHKIKPGRNDELGDLAISVNSMAEALKADIRKLKEIDVMKSEFMMITSHNLRTPLTIIQGYLELLMTKELPEDVKQTVRVVVASGNRLSAFAEDILTVSRIEAGENVMGVREKTDITELLKRISDNFEPLVKEKGLEFSCVLPQEPCYTLASMPHVRAAIWNILDNALKFTKEGTIKLELNIADGMLKVQVTDTGVGIADEEIPKLFTKFHRGTSTIQYEYEGTGIGLYLTKLIVDKHNGSITVDSNQGKGTKVTISLPKA